MRFIDLRCWNEDGLGDGGGLLKTFLSVSKPFVDLLREHAYMTWHRGSFQLNSTSIRSLTVFYSRLCLLEETDGDRMTSGAAGDAQYIGYDQNDLAYDLLNP